MVATCNLNFRIGWRLFISYEYICTLYAVFWELLLCTDRWFSHKTFLDMEYVDVSLISIFLKRLPQISCPKSSWVGQPSWVEHCQAQVQVRAPVWAPLSRKFQVRSSARQKFDMFKLVSKARIDFTKYCEKLECDKFGSSSTQLNM